MNLAAGTPWLCLGWEADGPVDEFVHKLKLLKRQGYGRAAFELLRVRMLAA